MNITFEDQLILMLTTKMHKLFCSMTLSPSSYLYRKGFINLLKSDVPSALITRTFQQLLFKLLKLL